MCWDGFFRPSCKVHHRPSTTHPMQVIVSATLSFDKGGMMRTLTVCLIMIAGFWFFGAAAGHAGAVDHSLYATLLNRHVEDGRVDYRGFKQDEAILDDYLETLAAAKPEALSREERFAFYINAYNAWTIKLILSRYPDIQSIKELGSLFSSPWKKKIARIDGQLLTLDQIEHDILRKQFKDPRIHFAVNCASKGCPPLLNEPYAADRIDRQLDRAATDFINDPRFNRLAGDVLWVSKIFDWFAEDFNDDVIGYFLNYAQGNLQQRLQADRNRIRVDYLDYDWSLNGI